MSPTTPSQPVDPDQPLDPDEDPEFGDGGEDLPDDED